MVASPGVMIAKFLPKVEKQHTHDECTQGSEDTLEIELSLFSSLVTLYLMQELLFQLVIVHISCSTTIIGIHSFAAH